MLHEKKSFVKRMVALKVTIDVTPKIKFHCRVAGLPENYRAN